MVLSLKGTVQRDFRPLGISKIQPTWATYPLTHSLKCFQFWIRFRGAIRIFRNLPGGGGGSDTPGSQSAFTWEPGVAANDELPIFGWELPEGQPVDVSEEEQRHAHNVPHVGVQVVHQLPVPCGSINIVAIYIKNFFVIHFLSSSALAVSAWLFRAEHLFLLLIQYCM